MSIARNAEFDSSVSNTLKEKDGVISDAADAIALDASGSNPQWRFCLLYTSPSPRDRG